MLFAKLPPSSRIAGGQAETVHLAVDRGPTWTAGDKPVMLDQRQNLERLALLRSEQLAP